jgi:hypothetical protein
MQSVESFENALNTEQKSAIFSLNTPAAIQAYLDELPYISEDLNRSPLRVVQDCQCHCLDGGMLAAVALRRLGFPSLLIDLTPEPGTDDDHVLAIFHQPGGWGAVAKSNFVGLRFREPVYRNLRELVMSYFEFFYNIDGVKTLRGYTRPLNLAVYDRTDWMCSQSGTNRVVARFYQRRSISLLTPAMVSTLEPMDKRTYEAGMQGVSFAGLYKPGSSH